jgi:hypothetical protein
VGSRLFVDAAFPAGRPFKMFDDVGDVSELPINTGFNQSLIKKPSGGSDERMPRQIFFIPRLLPDEHHRRFAHATFSKNCLGRVLIQIATHAAIGRRFEGSVIYRVRKIV